jgi:hypothetical protein
MTTAFSATELLSQRPFCLGRQYAEYKLQLPSSAASGGSTCDISGNFDYVTQVAMRLSGAAADGGYPQYCVGGTYDTTYKGYPASTIKVASYKDSATNIALGQMTAGDISTINDLIMSVWGFVL